MAWVRRPLRTENLGRRDLDYLKLFGGAKQKVALSAYHGYLSLSYRIAHLDRFGGAGATDVCQDASKSYPIPPGVLTNAQQRQTFGPHSREKLKVRTRKY